jgi:hypothetical protein
MAGSFENTRTVRMWFAATALVGGATVGYLATEGSSAQQHFNDTISCDNAADILYSDGQSPNAVADEAALQFVCPPDVVSLSERQPKDPDSYDPLLSADNQAYTDADHALKKLGERRVEYMAGGGLAGAAAVTGIWSIIITAPPPGTELLRRRHSRQRTSK